MSKVLLAVSERWIADALVDAIADFVKRLGGSVLALHVAYGTDGSGTEVRPEEKVLEKVVGQLRKAGVEGLEMQMLFSDDLGEAVLKVAEEQGVTMIMLGLSSKGMLTRLIEGNVAQEIIRGAEVPLLLLPHDWKAAL